MAARLGGVSEDVRSDEELVAAAARGDGRAFEALYYRHRDWVMGVAVRFAGERELALDVVQETFAYLHAKLPRLKLTARLTTFLYPVAKHTALAMRRKRRGVAGPVVEDVGLPAPAEGALGAYGALHAAVRALPEAQREVLLMRFVSGMEMAEIAAALELPVGTVKSRLHYALRAVGEALERGEEPEGA